MQLAFFFFFLFLTLGIYLLVCELFHLPTLASTKAMLNITQSNKKHLQLDAVILTLSSSLGKIIKLSDDYKKDLSLTLHSANISLQPETYIARAILRALLKLLFLIPFSLTLPILNLVVIAWAVAGLFTDFGEAQKKTKIKRQKIERELPRFVATIEQALQSNRDVLGILQNYKSSAGEEFKNELEITIADMNSGSQELALTRLESRVRSTMMSEVVRGLQAVMHGDNGVMHFAMLANDFKKQELQQLNMIAKKRPDKQKIFNLAILAGFFVTLFIPIGIYLYNIIHNII